MLLSIESPYDFCINQGWEGYVDNMIVVDYMIMNRDRHGANIEVLRNARAHTVRIAPGTTCAAKRKCKRKPVFEKGYHEIAVVRTMKAIIFFD